MFNDGWDLEGIPRQFWPRIREILQTQTQRQFTNQAAIVTSALVNALSIEAIARNAGPAGEGLARSAASFVADWEDGICPPYPWPPKKKRLIAEEVVELLGEMIDSVPEGHLANSLRVLGSSMQQKLTSKTSQFAPQATNQRATQTPGQVQMAGSARG
jgi:hypothetical protein